ncbi:MAG: sensor histidine kinase [Ilumatobacteraceae bacterium]
MSDVARRVAAGVRRHPTATDAGIAVLLAAAAMVSVSTTFELVGQDPSIDTPAKPALVIMLLAITLPLALRRLYPISVAAGVIAAFIIGRIVLSPRLAILPPWESYVTVWACWLALYSAVAHRADGRRAELFIFGISAVLFAEIVREIYRGSLPGLPLTRGFTLVYNLLALLLPVVLGSAVRSSRIRQSKLVAQAAELQQEREENARRAVLDERVRIARELHDVVAHHVSVMGLQAGAARRVMRTLPDKAEEVLSSIESSSRQAVLELHRLLGFLRREDQRDMLEPQPHLAQLPDLVAQAQRSGFNVQLSMEGEPRPLSGTLEVSAYRVVQEALTNALKHSSGTTATVCVNYRPNVLDIEVRDDGHGGNEPHTKLGGHGLIGMRERVGLHGGHLRVGTLAEGGFVVHATFPLGGTAT